MTASRVSTLTEATLRKFANQLDAEIAECENELRLARDHLDQLKKARRQIKLENPSRTTENEVPSPDGDLQGRRRRKGSMADIVRTNVRRILRETGHPLKRGEILERLEAEGVSVGSRNPAKRIGKIMWDAEDFVHAGDGYWFAGEPVPSTPNGAVQR